jgi:hypothetical protein
MTTFVLTLRMAALMLFLLGVLLLTASPSDAGGRGGRHGHGGGHGHGRGHGHGGGHHRHHGRHFHFHHFHGGVFAAIVPWWGPYWHYLPRYHVYPVPPVIVDEPPVYIEQFPPGYWYYCPSAREYYPSVPSCPEPWVRVAPQSQ